MADVEFLNVGYIQTQHNKRWGDLYTECGIIINDEQAEELKDKGWKVRYSHWNYNDSSFDRRTWLLLSCPSGEGFDLPKGIIQSVTVIVHPYSWKVKQRKGVKLFLKTICFHLKEE